MAHSIAIDGPAGAGKSTIARLLAKKLNYIYVDTGAMYRAMALFLLRNGIDAKDAAAVSEKCQEADITIRYENNEQAVYLNGENVNALLRTEEVGKMASASAANSAVREKLTQLQRALAKTADIVMDGRDIGTCVLPGADVKVYLTASSAVRAKRRFDELCAKGETCDIAVIEQDIIERDHNDMTRKIAPLRQAADAVRIDSSAMAIQEAVDAVLALCKWLLPDKE